MKFIKYLCREFLNGQNLAMYATKTGVQVRVERNGHAIGARRWFVTGEAAELWYESFPGSSVGRLANVIDDLDP